MRKGITGYHVFLLILALIALLGVAMLVWGAANHIPVPVQPRWTVARGIS